jgi:outer membrane translocation and assembly module TamA
MRTGYAQGQKIPVIKLFALGGIASVRGYQELQVNLPGMYPDALQSGSLEGQSLSYVNYRSQLDLPFNGAFKVGLFLDAANFLLNEYSLVPSFFGTGAGLHYQTPIGPVNFDVGFPLNPPLGANVSPYMIHFSVGII